MNKFFITLFSVVFSLSFFSCSSSDDVLNTLKDEYFTIDKATFNEGSLPVGKANSIFDFQTSGNVINGGSSFISLQSTELLQTIYVGVEGQQGFYAVDTKDLDTNQQAGRAGDDKVYRYSFAYVTPQQTKVEEYKLQVTAKLADGTISELHEKEIETITVGTGDVQVALSWDLLDDVDLYVFTPIDEVVYFGNDIVHDKNTDEIFAELDLDSNAACYIDAVNKENIFLTNAPVGVYEVAINLYEKCKKNPVEINYSINVHAAKGALMLSDKMSGVLIDEANGLSDENEIITIGYFEIKENGSVVVASAPKKDARIAIDRTQLVRKKK